MGVIGHLVTRRCRAPEVGAAKPTGNATAINIAWGYNDFRGPRRGRTGLRWAGITEAVT